jgi:DNA-binding protein YbaB
VAKHKKADLFSDAVLSEAHQQYDELNQKMHDTTVEVTVGATVTVKMNGHKEVLDITIKPTGDGFGMKVITSLLTDAINEAGRQVNWVMQDAVDGVVDKALLPELPPEKDTLQ